MAYYVYVLLCEGGSYYTGCTKDVASRFEQHKRGGGARYTRLHRPMKVVHVEEFDTRRDAMRRERAIKALTHKAKQKLAGSGDA
jgi:putative endonuclease